MQALIYYIALPFIYLLSLLPFSVLYALSDGMYFLIYQVLGYRKDVVLDNLRKSFPQKTDEEIVEISKKYYRHLCDLFLETFKTLTITNRKMLKHCRVSKDAKDLFDNVAAENRNVILVMGHNGNWEWGGNSFSIECQQQLFVIYHPLSNKYFDGLMYKMRSRFGTKLIPMKDTFKAMVSNKSGLNATAFIADQTPAPDNAYWTNFLNQDTPVFWGTEKISKKMNYPVIYVNIEKYKRGHYELLAEMLCENPKETGEGEITELFTRRLEQDIIAQPETWLWSHRRWKHKRAK